MVFAMNDKGFTLIELLIVIAIIGIIMGIALPSYQAHVQKGNRISAQLALSKIAQEFERTSARQGEYPISSAVTTILASIDTPDDIYTFTASISTTTTFEITATPVTTGFNSNDECGTMKIDQQGLTSADSSDCW